MEIVGEGDAMWDNKADRLIHQEQAPWHMTNGGNGSDGGGGDCDGGLGEGKNDE